MESALETAVMQWEEAHRRLESARIGASQRRRMRRAVETIQSELRRRLGSNFTVAELGDLYRAGTDWCLDIVFSQRDDGAEMLDSAIATDAAFYLYMREASDFAGGKVVSSEG